ncbi:hypothetical protein CFU_3501 [Collimonas fungivorans Ter331]|uniref:Uncharacterized protein n=1 Tax=Collimonas fungivorans (strain Ter331) TaxID=1005048 RepID=G0AAN1_COLFT|nr:hypothetical protein CFU_3501 [Collimonas fungivorans Ter331]
MGIGRKDMIINYPCVIPAKLAIRMSINPAPARQAGPVGT